MNAIDNNETLREYLRAVFEGRFATAEYLAPYLPDVDVSTNTKTSEHGPTAAGTIDLPGAPR